ncbi:hypothetical protein [Nocardioides ferulae]|uniref:HD domain-containing protein n=1 Tax=Nocardioides ferulae TaxID=2340821 RepID=UPI000EB06ECC|nr:hypothetical protein [Nocardioides ferulae]
MDLGDSWPLPDLTELREELLRAYDHPARGYHDTRHLAEVLARIDELGASGIGFERLPVLLAAWFHDGVYDGERDAEERSAVWAEQALAGLLTAQAVAEVARLVRLTETHHPEPGDANGSVLSDADLAILAAPEDRYDEYVAAVRGEFAHLDDEAFREGRTRVLHSLTARPHLFATDYARERWEAAARSNIERELAGLTPTRH